MWIDHRAVVRAVCLATLRKLFPFLFLFGVVGCSSSSRTGTEHVGASGQAVTVSGHTAILSIDGTYTSCKEHANGSLWSIATGGTASNPPVSIRQHDTACALTITALHDASGVLSVTPPIPVSTSYMAAGSEVRNAGGDLAAYANASANDLTYDGNVVITLLVSADASATTQNKGANKAHVTATALVNTVPAPNYTLDVSALDVETDAADIVTIVNGAATLNAGSQTAEGMLIVSDGVLPDDATMVWQDVANLWASSSPGRVITSIDESMLGLTGGTLPQIRHVVLGHTVNGVSSFEVLTVTFTP